MSYINAIFKNNYYQNDFFKKSSKKCDTATIIQGVLSKYTCTLFANTNFFFSKMKVFLDINNEKLFSWGKKEKPHR